MAVMISKSVRLEQSEPFRQGLAFVKCLGADGSHRTAVDYDGHFELQTTTSDAHSVVDEPDGLFAFQLVIPAISCFRPESFAAGGNIFLWSLIIAPWLHGLDPFFAGRNG